MWRLIRTEVFKLRTTKMYLWLLLAASALTVLITSIRIGRSTSAELAERLGFVEAYERVVDGATG